jgi:hypothetical protein
MCQANSTGKTAMLNFRSLIMKRAVWSALLCCGLPAFASAGTINMIISDMDVSYLGAALGNTGAVYDSIGVPGGNLNPAEADVLQSVVFEQNMVQVGTLTTAGNLNLYGDMKIGGVGVVLPQNALLSQIGANGGGYGFDFFTSAGNNIRLGIDKIDLLVTPGVLFFTGTASILSQNLPFGLAMDTSQPVVFSYTATLPGLVGGNPITGAMASGAMTITGQMVPEPTTATLIALGGMLGMTVLKRRK